MAAPNFYGYGGNLSQYSTSSSYSQSSTPQVFGVTQQQQTVQYGPYGNAVQPTAYETQSSYYTAPAGYGSASASGGYGSSAAAAAVTGYTANSASKTAFYQSTFGESAASSKYPSSSTAYSGMSSYKKPDVKSMEWSTDDLQGTQWQSSVGASTVTVKYPVTGSSYSAGEVSNFGKPVTASTTSSTIQLTGLDKALFTIASNYMQNQQKGPIGANQRQTWWNKRGKLPTDPSQWKYCDLCKMTCPGPQAYKLHLEGKTHKKKEATAAALSKSSAGGEVAASAAVYAAPIELSKSRSTYCTVCDVACSSQDAYAAHLRGAKHIKVVKVLQRMGKPVPDSCAVPVAQSSTANIANPAVSSLGAVTNPGGTGVRKVLGPPKIKFVGGTQLKSAVSGGLEEVSIDQQNEMFIGPIQPASAVSSAANTAAYADEDYVEEGVQPVGLEYLEEGLNDAGTAPSFFCKLCNCHFTDVMAKVMHTKGRRHRLQYKKKVDPTLKVDNKVVDRRAQLEKFRHKGIPEHWRKREMQATYKLEAEELRYEKEYLEWKLCEASGVRYNAPLPVVCWSSFGNGLQLEPSFYAEIDRCIQLRHQAIYPTEKELSVVQSLVGSCEKALKMVSDFLAERGSSSMEVESAGDALHRQLKGVMRVGHLAKGLLLHERLDVHLIVLCSDKPTLSLVNDIAENLPRYLQASDEEKYEVLNHEHEVIVKRINNDTSGTPSVACKISLTSPAIKDDETTDAEADPDKNQEPADLLNKELGLQLLAELRHAKWFQARLSPVSSCLTTLRLMIDLSQRHPAWSPLSQWALELLVEKVGTSAGPGAKVTAADVLIRFLQCIASGILLPGGPGLMDVCEKNPVDVTESLSNANREDLTCCAQLMLRQLLLGQASKVLDVEPLPLLSKLISTAGAVGNGATERKRPRISTY